MFGELPRSEGVTSTVKRRTPLVLKLVPVLALSSFWILPGVTRVNAAGAQSKDSGAAPKTAPDRRLRLTRVANPSHPEAIPSGSETQKPSVNVHGSSNSDEQPFDAMGGETGRSATTVSLQGGVTRHDSNASLEGSRPPIQGHIQGDQRLPFQGRIESLIDTPLEAQKPRSESIPPQTFRAWLESAHPQFSLNASRNAPESVICVKGHWDDSSKTLDKFQIPHVKIGSGKLASTNLANTRVVIVDCAGAINNAGKQNLQNFVKSGGYLLSTDWALDGFLTATFPNKIQWNKGMNRRDIVDATAFDTDPVLFNHAVTNAYWKLDQDSHLIHLEPSANVRVLAKSRQLIQDDPDRAGILAVVFPFGRGFVMHMTGHFDNNSKLVVGNFLPDPAPQIKISLRQALAANFVVAGLTGVRIPMRNAR